MGGAVNEGKSGLALLLNGTGSKAGHIALGTGSGAFSVNDTDLATPSHWVAFTSTDVTVQKKITYVADFDSVTISGTATIKEFGVFTSGAGAANTLWSKESFAGNAITADGTVEIQVQVTHEIV